MMAALIFFVLLKHWRSDMCNTRHALGTLGSLFVTFLLIAPVTSFGQKRGNTPGSGPTSTLERILIREADIENRELNLRILREPGKAKAPALSAENRKLIVSHIFEDFERIQTVNRELMRVSSSLNPATYKHMSILAEEMNKRAKRLKENLGIPGVTHEKKDAEKATDIDGTQLKASLQTLSTSVKTFVTNPLFQDPRVTDVRHLDSLRQAISNIIELSRTVKKAAVKLAPH